MSYLSLPFTSATQGMTNATRTACETEGDARAARDGLERAWNDIGGEADDYRLPSGIASMEHWLDLNA